MSASTMTTFVKGLFGNGTATSGADCPNNTPKNPSKAQLMQPDLEKGQGDGANEEQAQQSDDKASEDVPKKEKEGDDKTPNDKETGNATSDKGSAESSNEEATEDSKRTDDNSGKEKDDEKDDGGGETAETTPDHSDDEGNDEGGGEDDNDGDDEADEDNRKRSLQDPDSPGGGSASSGSDEGDESKGQKSTGTVSKRSALRAKKRLKKEDTDGSSKNKTVTSKGEKDEGRKCKDSTPSTPKEERRKRKPDSTGDSPPHSQSDLPELPKRLRHGADSSEEKRVGESAKSQPEDSSSEGEEAEIAVAGNDSAFKTPPRVPLKPPVTNLLVDFVHSPAPKISSLVEITRGHDPITSARPSVSLHSSQEDLSGAVSAASSEGHIVEDCAKLKADQAKTLRRAKDMLKAAFSEEDSSGSEEETSAEKATIVKKDPVVRAISDSDTDMQPQVTS